MLAWCSVLSENAQLGKSEAANIHPNLEASLEQRNSRHTWHRRFERHEHGDGAQHLVAVGAGKAAQVYHQTRAIKSSYSERRGASSSFRNR